MSWTQSDTSFKKLNNKRITTSTGKGLAEEKGASTLELYLPDIKTDLIPGTPPGASTSVLAYTGAIGQTLAVDTSVPGNMTWFATTGYGNTTTANDGSAGSEGNRLMGWISDKYDAFGTVSGNGYEIKVYDKDSNLITKADPSDWLFDYQTGILAFNNASTAYGPVTSSGPFRIVGYRYIGQKGIISAAYGGLGYTSYSLGDILVGAGSTFIKLPVGTNDYVLTADSTSTSGLKWSPTAATGITTLNSLTATTQFFAVGTSGSGFNISSSGSTHTFNIPIAGSGSTGLITTLSQTIAGQKTFTSAIVGDLSGTATSSTNVNVVNASSNATHPVLFTTASGTLSGAAVSSNSTISFNPSSFILSTSGLAVTSGIASTTFNTGALVVTGGVGIGGSLNVNGDLTVNGTTTTINSVTVTVDDKNIELGSVNSPTDLTAEGGGITLKGATDKFINWYSGTGWSSNQDWNLASGLAYKINNTSVLSATSLGTGVTNSSLTALGTITTGTWAGSIITSLYGGTGYSTYTKGDLLVGAGNTIIKFPVGNDLTILAADSSAATGVTWKGLLAPTYGAFASTSTQTVTGSNTVTFINFDTTFAANNVTIGTGTTNRIYINDTGLFDVQFSIQLDLAVSNQDEEVDIWFVVDGVYVPTSNTRQTVSGKDKETVITVNLVQSFISGQYVQLAYSSPAADLQIAAFSNLTGPTRPDIPGVILTIEPVSSILPGSGLAITGLASLNLLTANAQTLVTGTSGIDFNISSIGSVHTFNIPDASTTARGLITTGSQTLLGSKTFASGVAITATTASTGSTTGALIVSGGVGIGGSLFTSASYANSISGLAISNGVIFNGSWAGSLITARYGGTGYSSYSKGDLLVGAGGTFIKLGTGTNGYVLGLDSSLPAGLGWTTVSGVTISTTPPSGPKNADLWFNSEDGSLSVYYQDIDTSQWVEIALGSGIDLTSDVHITSTTGSTSSSTGALIVDGGVGVAGTVNASSFVVNGIYDEIGTTLTTSSTSANQVALSLSTSIYRSAKIFVQASSGSTYHSQEIMMLHDGSNVYMTEYAMVNSGAIGSTFDGDISGGNMRFLVTPSYAVTTYKIACSAMRI